jgi:hypothetical protein
MRLSNRVRWVVLACVYLGTVAGCGGDGASGDPGPSGLDLVYVDEGVADGGVDTVPPRDVPEDAASDVPDALDPDVILVNPPCGTDEACTEGRVCRTVPDAGGDLRLCVPGPDLLCAPCTLSPDCRPAGVVTADRCLGTAASGLFCAIDCSIGNGCPEGYECVTPPEAPHTVRQCVPAGGAECVCPPVAVEQGLATSCGRTNDFGTCKGTRTCTAGGLTACDAIEAVEETCNAVDDDCDGETDEGIVYGTCALQWGSVICVGPRLCVKGAPACKAGPPATETCNGYDDDCDGDTDEDGTADCTNVWLDTDGDEHGTGEPRCGCAFTAPWTARIGDDCKGDDAAVHPGAVEICDGKDNDCDGLTDPPGLPDCTVAYLDVDKDTFGDPATARCLCGPDAALLVLDGTDCNDGDFAIHPGAAEVCNGKDDDCDGLTDDGENRGGCLVYRADADLDNYGSAVDGPCLCHADGVWVTTTGGDCADEDNARNPGVVETCNDIDDDCDGSTDEDFQCDPNLLATEACGFCGTRERICGADCMWPEWSECQGSKTCAPGTKMPCAEGCGNLICGQDCEWATVCTWTRDSYETNDTRYTAMYLGYFEEPDSPANLQGWNHSADDMDWYSFRADEEWPFFPPVDTDGTLVAWASVVGGTGWHELCIYWDEGSNGVIDDTACTQGVGGLSVETSNVDPGLLEDASGMVYVSVRGDATCTPYTLSFDWD